MMNVKQNNIHATGIAAIAIKRIHSIRTNKRALALLDDEQNKTEIVLVHELLLFFPSEPYPYFP